MGGSGRRPASAVRAASNPAPSRIGARVDLPALPAWVVPRGRLDNLLSAGSDKLLTVVTGPAGAGKTMSAASWAVGSDHPGPILWLSCASGAGARTGFWAELRRAFEDGGLSIA